MPRYECVVYVDAPSRAAAKRLLLQAVEMAYDSPMEYVAEIASMLAPVKPPKKERSNAR